MRHQVRNVVLCGSIVLVLLGAWLLVSLLPEDSASGSSSEGQILPLIERDTAELTALTVQNTEGTLSFSLDESGVLQLDGCDDLPRYDTRYTALINAACSLSASRVVAESPDNPGEYGLDAPASIVTAVFSDGTQSVIEIGGQAPDRSGYYLRLSSSDTVYLSKTDLDNFFCGSGDFIGLTLIPSATEAQTVSIGDITFAGSSRSSSFTLKANETGHTVPLGGGYAAGGEEYSALLSNLSALTAAGAILPHPDEDALSAYGLANPRSTVTFTRIVEEDGETSSEPYTLRLGDKENGYYYAMLDGIDAVYLLADTSVTWAELSAEDFVSTQPVSLSAADAAAFSVQTDTLDVTFSITAEDGTVTGVTADGASVDKDQFQNLYLSFQALAYTTYQDSKPDADPLARITITASDGETYSFALIPASVRTVYVDTGNTGGFLVKEADVKTFLERVQWLLDGREVPSSY